MHRLVDGLDRSRELAAGFAGVSGQVAEPAVENSVGAGYDLSTPGGARSAAEELKESVGPAVALVHLNDARNGFGSHRDGHSKIGEGQIRGEAWVGLFAGLPGVPVIVETPYGGPEADAEEVRPVKELAGGLRKAPDGI